MSKKSNQALSSTPLPYPDTLLRLGLTVEIETSSKSMTIHNKPKLKFLHEIIQNMQDFEILPRKWLKVSKGKK